MDCQCNDQASTIPYWTLYFARDGGILQMARGVLTYFFARKKDSMFGGYMNGAAGMPGVLGGMPGGQSSLEAMWQLPSSTNLIALTGA